MNGTKYYKYITWESFGLVSLSSLHARIWSTSAVNFHSSAICESSWRKLQFNFLSAFAVLANLSTVNNNLLK